MGGRVEDYLELLKPRVMQLVVFTAFVGMLVAPGGINPVIGFIAILCIAIGGGASGALNMWYEAVIGGAAGAFPPMIGWAAVTGTISLDAVILFMIIFLWTPPHFWALALYKKGDYEAAGIPMLPNVAGERATQNQIVIYTVLLTIAGFGPVLTGLVGWFYGVPATALGVVFSALAIRLRFAEGVEMKRRARVLFTYSLLYLFVLFVALLADVGLIRWFGVF
jgi:protoheme IX farnesyltransferase